MMIAESCVLISVGRKTGVMSYHFNTNYIIVPYLGQKARGIAEAVLLHFRNFILKSLYTVSVLFLCFKQLIQLA